MEVYWHLRVSVFRLGNTDARMAEYQKIQPAKTIELRSYASSSSYLLYSLQDITKSEVTQPYTVPYWRHCRLACWNKGRLSSYMRIYS